MFALSFLHVVFVRLIICTFYWILPLLLPKTHFLNQSSRQAVLVMWQTPGNLFVTGRSFNYYSFPSVPYITLC